MFVMSANAFEALSRKAEQDFVVRLTCFLLEQIPDMRGELPESLRHEVSRMIDKARSYGLRSEQAIATFITTGAYLGTEFDVEFPAAAGILADHALDDESKAYCLQQWTSQLFDVLARK
jgi:hypothetical protein